MAKIYGEIASSALMTFDKSFARSNGQPLDSTEIFYSLTAAEEYAATDVAYVGQKIVVIEAGEKSTVITHYSIEADNSLKELGAIPVGDGSTIEVVDGKIQLAALDGHTSGTYQPYLVNGVIEWRVPSATTVEGLDARLKTIEDDYLTEEDYTTLQGEITTAANKAKEDAVAAVLGEAGIDEKFDTIKEIADWILSDITSSTELVAQVDAIAKDYLKGTDKTELQGNIDALSAYIGDIPEGSASDTVIAYVQEVVDDLKIGDYAKAADLVALTGRVVTTETKLAGIEAGAQVNIIESVDETQFGLDANKNLTLLDIAMGKVTGLEEALEAIGSDISTIEEKLADIEDDAQVNVLEAVKINGVALDITDKAVNIPVASGTAFGTVLSSDAENKVTVAADGTMEVNSLNISKLVQDENDELILDGGSSVK